MRNVFNSNLICMLGYFVNFQINKIATMVFNPVFEIVHIPNGIPPVINCQTSALSDTRAFLYHTIRIWTHSPTK